MKTFTIFARLFLFVLLVAGLAACNGFGGEQETQSYQHETPGYALSYPAGYQLDVVSDKVVEISKDPDDRSKQPRAYINTIITSSLTTETATEEFLAVYPTDAISRTDITIDSEPAVVLDGIPGQEPTRLVLFVHGGYLFKLNFTPADNAAGATYREMESLYETIVESFDFVP